MAMTVTASQGGTAVNGTLIAPYVLAGQAASPIGAIPTPSSTTTAPSLSITPNGNGSVVLGGVIVATPSTFSDLPSSHFDANVQDVTDGVCQGAFHNVTATATGTPLVLGASAPTAASTDIIICLLEILAGAGGILVDGSTPTPVQMTTLTATTASFNPPPGSLIAAVAVGDSHGTPGTMAVTGGGLTWTQRTPATGICNVGIWTALVPGVPLPVLNRQQAVTTSATR